MYSIVSDNLKSRETIFDGDESNIYSFFLEVVLPNNDAISLGYSHLKGIKFSKLAELISEREFLNIQKSCDIWPRKFPDGSMSFYVSPNEFTVRYSIVQSVQANTYLVIHGNTELSPMHVVLDLLGIWEIQENSSI